MIHLPPFGTQYLWFLDHVQYAKRRYAICIYQILPLKGAIFYKNATNVIIFIKSGNPLLKVVFVVNTQCNNKALRNIKYAARKGKWGSPFYRCKQTLFIENVQVTKLPLQWS